MKFDFDPFYNKVKISPEFQNAWTGATTWNLPDIVFDIKKFENSEEGRKCKDCSILIEHPKDPEKLTLELKIIKY